LFVRQGLEDPYEDFVERSCELRLLLEALQKLTGSGHRGAILANDVCLKELLEFDLTEY